MAGLLMLLMGCQSPAQERPAVLTVPTDAAHQLIESAASELLAGTPVRLAVDAFVSHSTVTLEHAPQPTPQGRAAGSLQLGKPEQLTLVRSGSSCVLLRVATGQRVHLKGVDCRAQAQP